MDKNIDYILEVAHCGGITKAAENLYITPSALSKFIIQRESELNVKLFHRVGKRFVPTNAGEIYIKKAESLQALQRELGIEMKNFSDMQNGILRIGVQSSFIEFMYRDLLPAFETELPGIRIITREMRLDELIGDLKNHKIDIMIAATDYEDDYIEKQKVCDCEYILAVEEHQPVCSKSIDNPDFPYPWIDVGDLRNLPFVRLSAQSPYHSFRDTLFARENILPNDLYQVSSTKAGLTCCAYTGACMVTLDQMVLANHFEHNLRIFSIGDKRVQVGLSLLYHRGSMLTEEINTLFRITKDELTKGGVH
ncbi:MAG: LysR family transcriptional regulator [Oribacterium sp.]|nr:LysR family transcriptional regulator [Oribacterium sp.]